MSMALNLSSIEAICHVLLLLLWRQRRQRHNWNLLLLLLLWWLLLLLLLLWWLLLLLLLRWLLLLWWLLLLLLLLRWRRQWLWCKVSMWLLWCIWELWLLLGLLEVLIERGGSRNHLMTPVVVSVAEHFPCLKNNTHDGEILVVLITIRKQPILKEIISLKQK
jgi:hypothetical protein